MPVILPISAGTLQGNKIEQPLPVLQMYLPHIPVWVKSQGLNAALFCSVSARLKPPGPSGIFELQL